MNRQAAMDYGKHRSTHTTEGEVQRGGDSAPGFIALGASPTSEKYLLRNALWRHTPHKAHPTRSQHRCAHRHSADDATNRPLKRGAKVPLEARDWGDVWRGNL